MVDTASGAKIRKLKDLKEMNADILISETVTDAEITVYRNGAYIYRTQGRYTVGSLEECKKVIYSSNDKNKNSYQIPADEINNCPWYIPVIMNGDSRMEHNRNSLELAYTAYSIDDSDSERLSDISTEDCAEEYFSSIETAELTERFKNALDKLTDKQRQVIELMYFSDDKFTQKDIADILGTSHQNINKILKSAYIKLGKLF